jgi:hypothetical protein
VSTVPASDAARLIAALDAGEQPAEGDVVRVLRRVSCPRELIDRLVFCRWVIGSRRVLQLVLRHPACPPHFAFDTLPHLGWHDVLDVSRDARSAPAIRRHAERRLGERLVTMTVGERTALARLAPRSLIPLLLGEASLTAVRALLDNPQFTEPDAIRLLHVTRDPAAVGAVLRHPVWGQRREVARAAVRSRITPLGVALGLLVMMRNDELAELGNAEDINDRLRTAAAELARHRMHAQ